jgi:hypothetical protein
MFMLEQSIKVDNMAEHAFLSQQNAPTGQHLVL